MKLKTLVWTIAMTSCPALVAPVLLPAQELQENKERREEKDSKEHHRYKLIDIGTFGGPESYINNAMSLGSPRQINRNGTVVGSSATSIPSPPDSNFSVCGGLDGTVPFAFRAFQWRDGDVTDLGALPGVDNCSVATSINARGEIVGYSENGLVDSLTGKRQIRAVLWKDGEIRDLGTFGGNHSLVGSINNRGQVAGSALNAIPDPFSFYDLLLGFSTGTQTRAFLWEDGHKHDLGTLGGPDAFAAFVNDHGQVIGSSYADSTPNPTTGLPTQDPFLWTKEEGMIDLGTLGGTLGFANAMNNRGEVIGTSNLAGDQVSDPFLWDGEKLIDLFTATIGGNPITANALNDAGEIVGFAAFPNGAFDAYLWKGGVATDLGTLAGDCFSEAVAINSKGQVVGYSFSCASMIQRSFLWENGSMVDLNTLIPPNSNLQLVETLAINDRGGIAGDGLPPGCLKGDGQCGHAYVLIPCERGHSDAEGCEDEGEDTAVATQRSSAPVTRPADATQGALTPEILAALRVRFARRYRGFGIWPRK
jgi:probable HAF family extracellular repeat protein